MIIGKPITLKTFEAKYEDFTPEQKKLYATDDDKRRYIAQMAMEQISQTDEEALMMANSLKANFGNGISTLLRIYNATGETLSWKRDYSWYGRFYSEADPLIQNGQWSVLLHVRRTGFLWLTAGSSGGLVYETESKFPFNKSQAPAQVFMGWSTPYWFGTNRCQVKIGADMVSGLCDDKNPASHQPGLLEQPGQNQRWESAEVPALWAMSFIGNDSSAQVKIVLQRIKAS